MDEIVNKVAKRNIKTIDLEDFYPSGSRIVFDIANYLYEGLILKEKEFREQLESHSWEKYKNSYVALTCSTDAIIPSWAYILITTKLQPYTNKVITGSLEVLETVIFYDIINQIDILEYQDQLVIVKGCSNKPIPLSAYNFLVLKLQPVVKSIMFGEACSTVPLFKSKRKKP